MSRPKKVIKLEQKDFKQIMKREVQSYIFSCAKFKYTVDENRLKYMIAAYAQDELRDKKFSENMCRIHHLEEGRCYDVEMQIKDVMNAANEEDRSKHYERVKAAARNLQKKLIEVEDTENGEYWSATLVMDVHISRRKGTMNFLVADWVMTAILDFTHGYRDIEMKAMMRLRSPNSMRMYELIAKQGENLIYSIDKLKELFGAKSYKTTQNFINRIIEPSKKELDSSCPWTFSYIRLNGDKEPIKDGARGRGSKVEYLRLIPIRQKQFEDPDVLKDKEAAQIYNIINKNNLLEQNVANYLLYNIGMDEEGINAQANKALFLEAQKKWGGEQFVEKLGELKTKAAQNKKGIGWIIKAIRGKLKDEFGIELQASD